MFDLIDLINRKVVIPPGKVCSLDVYLRELGVTLILFEGGVLQRIQRHPNDLSKLVSLDIRANVLPLIGKTVVLSSLLYLVLHKSGILISEVDLLDLGIYSHHILREIY